MCQKWFAKFCAGDFSLDDAPPLDRPAEVDSNQIKTLVENYQCYTIQEMGNILKISKSMRLFVKIKTMYFILLKKPHGPFGQPNITEPLLGATHDDEKDLSLTFRASQRSDREMGNN